MQLLFAAPRIPVATSSQASAVRSVHVSLSISFLVVLMPVYRPSAEQRLSSWALEEDVVRGEVAELEIDPLLSRAFFAVEIFVQDTIPITVGPGSITTCC